LDWLRRINWWRKFPQVWEDALARYCLDCHDSDSVKGSIDLEEALFSDIGEHSAVWEKTVWQLRSQQMPPEGKDRPDEQEYEKLARSLEAALDAHAQSHPDPGRTNSLRRLTRTEYANSIRDLFGFEIDVAALLPPEQSSHDFDNVTVGDLPSALLDRYIGAAGKISREVVGSGGGRPYSRTVRVPPDLTQEGHIEGLPFGTKGGVVFAHRFPCFGQYEFRVHLMRGEASDLSC